MPQNECLYALLPTPTNCASSSVSQSVHGIHADIDGISLPFPVKCRGRQKGVARTAVRERKHK